MMFIPIYIDLTTNKIINFTDKYYSNISDCVDVINKEIQNVIELQFIKTLPSKNILFYSSDGYAKVEEKLIIDQQRTLIFVYDNENEILISLKETKTGYFINTNSIKPLYKFCILERVKQEINQHNDDDNDIIKETPVVVSQYVPKETTIKKPQLSLKFSEELADKVKNRKKSNINIEKLIINNKYTSPKTSEFQKELKEKIESMNISYDDDISETTLKQITGDDTYTIRNMPEMYMSKSFILDKLILNKMMDFKKKIE